MKAVIIKYEASNLTKTEASKLSKRLFGYIDKSNKGTYLYKRRGLVTEQPHIRFTRGLFAVPKNKAKRIINLIKKKGGRVEIWEVELKKDYFK